MRRGTRNGIIISMCVGVPMLVLGALQLAGVIDLDNGAHRDKPTPAEKRREFGRRSGETARVLGDAMWTYGPDDDILIISPGKGTCDEWVLRGLAGKERELLEENGFRGLQCAGGVGIRAPWSLPVTVRSLDE